MAKMNERISKALYDIDVFKAVLAFGTVFLLGGAFAFFIWGNHPDNIFRTIWKKISGGNPKDALDFLSTSAEVLATLVGVSIPISLAIISENLKMYKDKWVSNIVKEEKAYQAQLYFVLLTIIYILTLIFFNWTHPCLLTLAFLFLLISILVFVAFIRMMIGYATNTDDIVLKKAKKQINEILE